mmetsp:Transcript_36784/g.86246  ORF Transcript_36784/g.86246 Transcript_36784/m.86246 type:complete len:669 (+) Transcript_36784:37-2043(+)
MRRVRSGLPDPEIGESLLRLGQAVLLFFSCRQRKGSHSDDSVVSGVEDVTFAASPWPSRVWIGGRYTGVFILGVVCSLIFGWIQPPALPKTPAYDELLASEAVERLLNGTLKLRETLDSQAAAVAGRMQNVREMLGKGLAGGEGGGREEEERVGVRLAKRGLTVHNPVVMIPGIITTGLEVWDGEECIRNYFRQRIWGSATMLQSIFRDPDCWVRHLALNSTTGLDPLQSPFFNKSIRVRAAQGFESADFFLAGYWLWGLMIEALADIGYDSNSMHMASYDWRLSFADLENRDRYFTRLVNAIETLVSINGKKALIVAHSMGGNLWHYFQQWVMHRVHPNWVHDHIYGEVMISAPMLGLPKAFFSLLTGDNRDFASMGKGFAALIEYFFGPMTRRRLWRSCSSLAMIMPIGGESVWGVNLTGRPLVQVGDDAFNAIEAYDLLANDSSVPADLKRIALWLLDGMRRSEPEQVHPSVQFHELPEHVWGNPLVAPLPFAPHMRKYAFYGVGVRTDVSGALQESGDDVSQPRYAINKEATKDRGFHYGDGDYSVPLHSLGMMCLEGWKDPRRNPAQSRCTIREYKDSPLKAGKTYSILDAAKAAGEVVGAQTIQAILSGGYSRGGQPSGDHIDILGNDLMLEDLLRVANGEDVPEQIVSDLRDISQRWRQAG